MDSRRGRRVFLAVLILLAVVTRFWGLGWGLPHTYHIDENRFQAIAVQFLRGDLNPHFFHVGTLHMYLLAGMWKAYQGVGGFDSTEAMIASLVKDPTPFYLIGRGLSAVLGVGVVLLIYLLGLRMFGFRVGAAAGLFMTFSLEHIKISHAMLPDGPTLFFVVLSFYLARRIYQTGRTRFYVLVGLTAGIAMAMKYAGHMMAIPVFAAHVARILENGLPKKRILLDLRLYLFGAVFLAVFVAGCPYAVLDFKRFLTDFKWQSAHLMKTGHYGSALTEPAWLFQLNYGFRDNVGVWIRYLSFLGLGLALARRQARHWILLSYPVLQFLLIGTWKAYATRYFLPIAPFFILLAGLGAEQAGLWAAAGWRRLRRRAGALLPAAGLLIAVVSLVAAAPSAWTAIRYDRQIAGTDTRTEARDWFHWNIPAGERVAIEEYDPPISRQKYDTFYRHFLSDIDLEHLVRNRIRYVIVNDIDSARWTDYAEVYPGRAVFYFDLERTATLIKSFRPAWNEDLIDLHNPTIWIYRLPAPDDARFPGHFAGFGADVDVDRKADGSWRVRAEMSGRLGPYTGEQPAFPYVRLRAAQGRELLRLELLAGAWPDGEGRASAEGTLSRLPEGAEIVLGYSYALVPNPLREPPEQPFRIETALTDKADAEVLSSGRWSARFRYAGESDAAAGPVSWPVQISVRGGRAVLRAGLRGHALRYGEAALDAPAVELADADGKPLRRLVLAPGRTGSLPGAAPLPEEASVSWTAAAGVYRVYADRKGALASGQAATGPVRLELVPPVVLR